MKFKKEFFKFNRIFIIFLVISVLALPFLVKTGNNDVCYKSEASFWGRQDMKIDCNSNNVDLIKKNEYMDFGFNQLKGILIFTMIVNLIVWINNIEFAKSKDCVGVKE